MMQFYGEQHVKKPRMAHKCEMCGGIIKAGEPYWRESGKFNGEFFSRTLHETCHEMEREFCEHIDTEFSWDEIQDYIQERYCYNCEHSGRFDDREGWTECDTTVCECAKIKAALGKEHD